MSEFDVLFARAVAASTADLPPQQLDESADALIAAAGRKRRTRRRVNTTLALALSLVCGGAVWLATAPAAVPVEDPSPSPSASPVLQYGLSEPSLNPVWEGSQPVPMPGVPAAFDDGLDPASLPPLVESPGDSYPEAHQMTDAIWDAVGAGWSLETWSGQMTGDDADSPNNLYLVSTAGTRFLLRELDRYEGAEYWMATAWSLEPGLALLDVGAGETGAGGQVLQDLRTGEELRFWKRAAGTNSGDATLLATGFEGDRTVTVYFTNTVNGEETYGFDNMDPGAVAHILGPDGEDRSVRMPTWTGGSPQLSAPGPDGKSALLFSVERDSVVVVDLDAARARTVALDLPDGNYCIAYAPGDAGTILALCPTSTPDQNDLVTFSPDGKEVSRETAVEPLAVAGFDSAEGVLTDNVVGTAIDLSHTYLTYSYFAPCADEYAADRFAVTDCGHGQLLLYDRSSGGALTIVGIHAPGSRGPSGVTSVVTLWEYVPGRVTFDMRVRG